MNDLQDIQFKDLYLEDDMPLSNVRKSALRKLVYVALFIFVALVVLCATVKFPNQIHLPFVLQYENQETIYRYAYPIFLSKCFVNSGKKVSKGDKLAIINSNEISQLISEYKKAVFSLELFKTSELQLIDKQSEILRLDISKKQIHLARLIEKQKNLEVFWSNDSMSLASDYHEMNEIYLTNLTLNEDSVVSDFDLSLSNSSRMKIYNKLVNAENTYKEQKLNIINEIKGNHIEVKQLSQTIEKMELEKNKSMQSLRNNLNITYNQINSQFGDFDLDQEGIILKASSTGKINYVFEGSNEISEGVILMKITNEANHLFASASITPQHIGKIINNSLVTLKVASFPHYEWGSVKARIEFMSKSPNEKGLYPIHATIEDAGQLKHSLLAGMTGVCSITLEEKSIFGYFIRNINGSIDNTLE